MGEMVGTMVVSNPKNSITHMTCLLGKQYDEPEIQELMAVLPYTCVRMPNGTVGVKVMLTSSYVITGHTGWRGDGTGSGAGVGCNSASSQAYM